MVLILVPVPNLNDGIYEISQSIEDYSDENGNNDICDVVIL